MSDTRRLNISSVNNSEHPLFNVTQHWAVLLYSSYLNDLVPRQCCLLTNFNMLFIQKYLKELFTFEKTVADNLLTLMSSKMSMSFFLQSKRK